MGRVLAILSAPAIAAASLIASWAAFAQPSVDDVRIGLHGQVTRLVIELSEETAFRAFTLQQPYRAVIDIPQSSWKVRRPRVEPRGLIRGMRHGVFKPGTYRIALDLSGPAAIDRAFFLRKGDKRLVIDLRPVAARDFRTASVGEFVTPTLALTQPTLNRKRRNPKPIIVIDAGHGGVDPGAIGRSGTYEKTVTLKAARILRDRLLATKRYRVALTRNKDVFLRLRERVARARAANADLFISLHADSIGKRDVHGFSVYTLSERASDAEAAALAEKENKADVIAGVDLSEGNEEVASILIDLAQRDTMNLSARYASMVVDEVSNRTQLLRKPHRFAGFAVLKAPDVPSILVEMGFLSHRKDEKRLRSERFLRNLSDGIVKATNRYFDYQLALNR